VSAPRAFLRHAARRRRLAAGPLDSSRPHIAARQPTTSNPRPVGIRRSRLPARLPALPLRRSERAEGRAFSQIGPDRQFNQNFLTFNSLNSYILKGDAAQGMELTFATLMVRSGDEPDAMYGLAAESAPLGRRPHLSVLHPARGQSSTTARRSPPMTSPSRSISSRKKATR
jgi:hypothetical protein